MTTWGGLQKQVSYVTTPNFTAEMNMSTAWYKKGL